MTLYEGVGRNDSCPCGSGLKFKKCCMHKTLAPSERRLSDEYLRRYQIYLKTPQDIAAMRVAGRLVVDTLFKARDMIKPGITTEDINKVVHEYTLQNGAIPAPLNYNGFPKSVCTSVNDVICHGIPSSEQILKDGDIINVDVTSILNGYYADANMTFPVGDCSPEALRLMEVARNSLKKACAVLKPGNRIGDIGAVIQDYAEGEGCSVVREYVGHGIGKNFHESPNVPHYGKKGTGIKLVPGMVFTVEPMLNLGLPHSRVLDDDWTAVTVDGSLSAQYEQTFVITESGYESLTPYEL